MHTEAGAAISTVMDVTLGLLADLTASREGVVMAE